MPDLALDLRYLRYALAAAEHGSFRRAATALGLPQSTVSRRIQLLEASLGASLFERKRTGVRPTPAGDRFLKEAIISASRLHRAAQELILARRGNQGELRIGLVASFARGFLSDLIGAYRAAFPRIRIELFEETPQANLAGVMNGRLDVAFLAGKPIISECSSLHLWDERIYLALPETHRLASATEISWQDVRDEPFIVGVGGPGPEIEDYLVKRLSSPGFRPVIDAHRVGRENLINMVAKGFGLTLTTDSTLGTAFAGVVFRPMAGNSDIVPSSAIWSTGNPNPALKHLLHLGRQMDRRTTHAASRSNFHLKR
ncbi:LysR family transcriptional regulator [Sphingomonas sp. So64.6b]|nr:LysR family transcriptional regulator [Sphingomonas sp. So64.6b]